MSLLEIWRENKAKRGYGGVDYDDLLRASGHEIVESEEFGAYQGDFVFLLRKAGRYGIAVVGYGSCSGCDALQAAEPSGDVSADDEQAQRQLAEVQALADQLAGEVVWPAEGKSLAMAVEEKVAADKWWVYDEPILNYVRLIAGRADA